MVIACILFRALCCQGRFFNVGAGGGLGIWGGQEEKEKGGNEVKSVLWEREKEEMMV